MRSDISKILVTTARYGSRLKNGEVRSLRRERITEDYDGPTKTSMKPSHHRFTDRKELNEYLSPLYRYLEKSVGQKWNDIYSDVCAHNKRGSAVGEHIFIHLFDYVRVKPTIPDDIYTYNPFFVNADGLLCKSPVRKWAGLQRKIPDTWRATDDEKIWYVCRDDGCWFQWTLVEANNTIEDWWLCKRVPKGFSNGLPTLGSHKGALRTLSRGEKRDLDLRAKTSHLK